MNEYVENIKREFYKMAMDISNKMLPYWEENPHSILYWDDAIWFEKYDVGERAFLFSDGSNS